MGRKRARVIHCETPTDSPWLDERNTGLLVGAKRAGKAGRARPRVRGHHQPERHHNSTEHNKKTVPFSGFDGAFPSLMTHRLIIKGGCPAPPPHPVSNRSCMSLATTCARQHHPVMLVAWELRGPNRGKRGLPSKWCSNNPLVHLPSGSPCPRELVSPTPACCRRRLAVRYTASAVYAGSVESHGCLDAAAAGSLPTVVPSHGDSLGCWELIDARLRNRLPRPYPYLRAAPVLPADKIDKRNRATDSQLH